MKKKLLCLSFFLSGFAFSQVGINTETPNATLDIQAKNPSGTFTNQEGLLVPRVTRQRAQSMQNIIESTLIYITEASTGSQTNTTIDVNEKGHYYFDGTKWRKLIVPTINGTTLSYINGITNSGSNVKLGGTLTEPTTIGTSVTNTLKITGLPTGNAAGDRILVMDNDNILKTVSDFYGQLSIPRPAVFNLETNMTNFLSGVSSLGSSVVNMSMIKNEIEGLTFNEATRTISLPTGIYQTIFLYEATHSATSCTRASYFVDFPITSLQTTKRMTSSPSFTQGTNSNHGGTLSMVVDLDEPVSYQIRLGRGPSGNCTGNGMTLFANSTQLLLFRIGD